MREINNITEKFLIDQIVLYYGTYDRFGNKYDEQMAYRRLEQLRVQKGLKDADEAVDYMIAVLDSGEAKLVS
ncbi:hypothetical protein [Solibacillus sp. CAU 1738]|uniref:hypothetical protein n=1 Tax=Solibacillus sp. CAU 1738 TaxID=3140363 RepID=UPI00325FF764